MPDHCKSCNRLLDLRFTLGLKGGRRPPQKKYSKFIDVWHTPFLNRFQIFPAINSHKFSIRAIFILQNLDRLPEYILLSVTGETTQLLPLNCSAVLRMLQYRSESILPASIYSDGG